MALIQAENVTKEYTSGEDKVTALQGVNLTVEEGEFLALVGPSGSGKSTLLSILGALNPPSSGRVTIDGIDIYQLSAERRADFRSVYMGFIFQQLHLVPYLYNGVTVASVASTREATLSIDIIATVRQIPAADKITVVAPKLIQNVTFQGIPVVVAGVDLKAEKDLHPYWQVAGEMPTGPGEVLLGSDTARHLKVLPGASLAVGASDLRVAGVLAETGGVEDGLVYMDLESLQDLVGKAGQVSIIELAVRGAEKGPGVGDPATEVLSQPNFRTPALVLADFLPFVYPLSLGNSGGGIRKS
ncbi:MAG: putative transport system ATP-binding protein, partial [Clostridia bacterium]|nr:putative transport system ATP-binding protein [Clostridia bacterium]